MFDISIIQRALQKKPSVHGWIFTNFSHRDSLTDSILSLDTNTISSRRWVYIIESNKEPRKFVHAIEASILDSLPGKKEIYSGQKELKDLLSSCAEKKFAVLADSNISVISTVDAGFIDTLHACNIKTTSAAPLIQISKGLLTSKGIESHERAASLLYKIVKESWDFISYHYKAELELTELSVYNFILGKFDEYSLVYDHEPIVAFGKNAGNPHYGVPSTSSAIAKKGDIIQLDIFAKEAFATDIDGTITKEAAMYADISWVGVYDTEKNDLYNKTFADLISARDIVHAYLSQKATTSNIFDVTGCELDKAVRTSLIDAGYEQYLKHRTGHGIDTECHGSGVNLDSVEFPDFRTMLNGSCFSVEPGIYQEHFGMRTEIDIYINNGKPIISGNLYKKNDTLDIPQKTLLYIV